MTATSASVTPGTTPGTTPGLDPDFDPALHEEMAAVDRLVEVDAGTTNRPRSVQRLRDWEYLERQQHRLVLAVARYASEWEDIVTMHRFVWEQAECVRRLRERLVQFPGGQANLDQPVSSELEALGNAVLEAPTHADLVEGVWGLYGHAVNRSYAFYAAHAHPIHDKPTLELINEVLRIKEGFRLWLHAFRRRVDEQGVALDAAYREKVLAAVAGCGELMSPLEPTDPPAQPVGVATGHRLPAFAARPAGSAPRADPMPTVIARFRTDVQVRRFWWSFAYAKEINLAMDQLLWLWDAPYMPWEFHHDISRHLWDESRHGDSGHSRLLDFGITLQELGLGSYDPDEPWSDRPPTIPQLGDDAPGALPATGHAVPRTPAQLYERMYHIGMLAESGHFTVKRQGYEDFKAGGDMESAEMMLFDVVDEQTHVQYSHRWLPLLAEHAGIDASDYRQRAAKERKELADQAAAEAAAAEASPPDPDSPGAQLCERMLAKMQAAHPLSNADDHAPRAMIPML